MAAKGNANKKEIIACLNDILEHELAGVVRYSHYSLMIYGHNRIPIVSWFRNQGSESLTHAHQVGEWITSFEEHPSLKIGKLLETQKHSIRDILIETLEHESEQLGKYKKLLGLLSPDDVALEEYTRGMILEETLHLDEVKKMMRSM